MKIDDDLNRYCLIVFERAIGLTADHLGLTLISAIVTVAMGVGYWSLRAALSN